MEKNKVQIIVGAKDEASGIFESLKGKVAGVAAAVVGYFGFSMFSSAVKGATDLEARLSEVKAVSSATAAEMVLLRKAAEDAGGSTKFTATEAAEALGNLARAGLSSRQAIEALPATLSLAQAGNLGLAESSEIVTRTISGFTLKAADAGRIADVLAAGANASNTSVTGLGQALSYTAPTAVALGLSLEQTVAIIGKFADSGIDASRAGTALNAILSQFSDPASKFRQELGAAGITTKNFDTALRQLAKAGPAGQQAILAVGTEAGPALRALLNQGIGALDDLKGKLDAAGGSAAATAAIMSDNLAGSAAGLSSAWDTVKNALATPVLPILKEGVDGLAKSLQAAVADGTVGRFGDAIAKGFDAALTNARAFLAEVDFAALGARVSAAADTAKQSFETLKTYATNAGNTVGLVWGVMAAGSNTVITAVSVVAGALAELGSLGLQAASKIADGLSRVTFGGVSQRFKEAAADLKIQSGAMGAASDALAARAREAFVAVGDGAQLARNSFAELAGASTAAAQQGTQAAGAFKQIATTLVETGSKADALGDKAKASAVVQTQAAQAVRAEVAKLKTEYEAALAAGNLQLALEKLTQMKAALAATGATAKVTAEDIAQAFSNAGIKTKTELAGIANKAQADFELIKNSGLATADGLQKAFEKYALASIAANSGVATEAIKTQAAMRGLEISVDAAGKTALRAMGDAAGATDGAGAAAGRAAEKYSQLELAAMAAAKAAKIEGDAREQKLKGQAATDGSGAYALRAKQKNGTLSADDLKTAEAVMAAAQYNKDMYDGNSQAYSHDGARSVAAEYNSAKMLLEEVKAKQASASQKQGTSQAKQGSASNSQKFSGGKTPEEVYAESMSPENQFIREKKNLDSLKKLLASGYKFEELTKYEDGSFDKPRESSSTGGRNAASVNAPPAQQSSQPAAQQTGSANTYLVKLDFGSGPKQSINVVSANDAQTLIAAFQQAKLAMGI